MFNIHTVRSLLKCVTCPVVMCWMNALSPQRCPWFSARVISVSLKRDAPRDRPPTIARLCPPVARLVNVFLPWLGSGLFQHLGRSCPTWKLHSLSAGFTAPRSQETSPLLCQFTTAENPLVVSSSATCPKIMSSSKSHNDPRLVPHQFLHLS